MIAYDFAGKVIDFIKTLNFFSFIFNFIGLEFTFCCGQLFSPRKPFTNITEPQRKIERRG